MPKLIDYSARFELIREAVVRIAARDGGAAVTLESVAVEMRLSASTLRRTLSSPDVLPEVGVVWLARQRQQRRFRRGLPLRIERGSVGQAHWLLWGELPSDEEDIGQARAWAELTVVGTSARVATLRRDRDLYLDELVAQVIDFLEAAVASRELEGVRLRALLDGLVAAACRGTVTAEQMSASLEEHLLELMARERGQAPLTVSRDASGSPR
ncbi:MAG: hypothetical protein ABWY19_01560 [Marmoricola sp.]